MTEMSNTDRTMQWQGVMEGDPPVVESTRDRVLSSAVEAVTMTKAEEHGSAQANFTLIADLWTAYLGTLVQSHDVAQMMVLLKVARSRSKPGNIDNYVDEAGYAALAAEVHMGR